MSSHILVQTRPWSLRQFSEKKKLGWPTAHDFYLVTLENGQKVQKKCYLRVANGASGNGLIY